MVCLRSRWRDGAAATYFAGAFVAAAAANEERFHINKLARACMRARLEGLT